MSVVRMGPGGAGAWSGGQDPARWSGVAAAAAGGCYGSFRMRMRATLSARAAFGFAGGKIGLLLRSVFPWMQVGSGSGSMLLLVVCTGSAVSLDVRDERGPRGSMTPGRGGGPGQSLWDDSTRGLAITECAGTSAEPACQFSRCPLLRSCFSAQDVKAWFHEISIGLRVECCGPQLLQQRRVVLRGSYMKQPHPQDQGRFSAPQPLGCGPGRPPPSTGDESSYPQQTGEVRNPGLL